MISVWLNEKVMYGGIPTRRADVIADLQRIAPSQIYVDRYLQGLAIARDDSQEPPTSTAIYILMT